MLLLFIILTEKATSKLLLDPDWESTMLICDAIRQGDVQLVLNFIVFIVLLY